MHSEQKAEMNARFPGKIGKVKVPCGRMPDSCYSLRNAMLMSRISKRPTNCHKRVSADLSRIMVDSAAFVSHPEVA